MDGPRDYHTKWNKPEKDKYISFYLYVESKKMMIQMHLLSRNRLTNIGFF